ncbi:MAG: hypothetical protein ACPICH_06660 [Poseidonia sp.]
MNSPLGTIPASSPAHLLSPFGVDEEANSGVFSTTLHENMTGGRLRTIEAGVSLHANNCRERIKSART